MYDHYRVKRSNNAQSPYYSAGQQAGSKLINDLNSFTQYKPGTPEYSNWTQKNNITPEHAMALSGINSNLQSYVGDPNNYNNGIPDMSKAFTPENQAAIEQYYAPQQGMGTQLLQSGLNAVNFAQPVLKHIPGMQPGLDAANFAMQAPRQAFIGGMSQAAQSDNPYTNQLRAHGATAYMQNRIGNFFDGSLTGGFGKSIGGILQWLVRLLSRAPGYETVVNKLLPYLQSAPQQPSQQAITGETPSSSLNTQN